MDSGFHRNDVRVCGKLDISLDPSFYEGIMGGETVYFDETILVPADATDIDNPYCCDMVFTAGDSEIGTQRVCVTVQREVTIDIKPGSFPNSINMKRLTGVIPVAILGTADFDVTLVDVTTLKFGQTYTNQVPAHDLADGFVYADHLQDVNADGLMDLVSHISSAVRALRQVTQLPASQARHSTVSTSKVGTVC